MMSQYSVDPQPLFEVDVVDARGWIEKLMATLELQPGDGPRAMRAMRAGLHAIRDRLSAVEVADLAVRMPVLIRGIYYEGWQPANKPVKERKKEEFLTHIAQAFRDDPIDPEEVTRAVLGVLTRHVSCGEVAHLEHLLPTEIRSLL